MKKIASALMLTLIVIGGVRAADIKQSSAKPTLSLTDARSSIAEAISSPAKMQATVAQMSAEDQCKFLAEVNAAVAKMPGSPADRVAKFVEVSRAALKGAQKGNVAAMVAETFATVAPEALPAICESLSQDMLNRASDPRMALTDTQFEKIAVDLLKKINERTATEENGVGRSAFAVTMMMKASNGTSEELLDKLVETLPEGSHDMVKQDLVKPVLNAGDSMSAYEPLLAATDAGRRPDLAMALPITGVQFHDSVLADMAHRNIEDAMFMNARTPVVDAVQNTLNYQIPTLGGDVDRGGAPKPQSGGNVTGGGEVPPPGVNPDEPQPQPEPEPYRGQSTRW